MHVVDLSKLTKAQVAEFDRQYKANIAIYSLTEVEALKGNNGFIAKVAASVALKENRNRRQPIWMTR
ncbi:hypothetical protein [Rhizobium leguminosarum]|uniref:Uncharacterized protein n=1 Tax=Rhizobium leguminosarum TaxID=384 RepID=A0A7K3VSS6_RHILE|nr:hypothetical protein [Rhizobium leguminosarum]NEK19934.1 hypothetical protein [Rhizobium leguminosarum]